MVYLLLTPSRVIVNTTFVSSINYIFVFVINARNIHECCTQGFVHYKLTNCGLDQRRSDANTDQGRLKRQIFGICRETRIFYCPACTYFYQILNKCLSLRFQFFFIAVKLESDHIKPFWSSIASLRRKRNKVVKNKLKKTIGVQYEATLFSYDQFDRKTIFTGIRSYLKYTPLHMIF